ncbi:MAG: hypothetical protein KF830_17745 [Planctomycetes bacterium]|nr:hypothetical protein [Planctomycetota bacterium]
MEVALILLPIFAYLVVRRGLDYRAAVRADTVRLLEEALRNPAVDRATIESLAHQLTGRRSPRDGGLGSWSAMVLAVGWIALFVGTALVVAGGMVVGDQDLLIGGIVVGTTGFGLVTWPFALRELEARRQPQ